MFIDARSIPNNETLEADVCIIGAGPAGISLAMEFAGAQFSVLLLEGGGKKFEHRSQFLHRGRSRGRKYPPLENTRRRQLGGASSVWFGRCRPLDAMDFDVRPWFPNSGWPIPKSELDSYVERALTLCQVESRSFHLNHDPFAGSGLESKLFLFSPPTDFGAVYAPELLHASNIRVVLHANASTIEVESEGTRASRVVCATLNGKKLMVASRIFALATGGLENPRLLLNSRNVHASGIANADDLVGRYFMEHIYSYTASVTSLPASFPPDHLRLNYETLQRNLGPTPALGLPEAVMRQQQLPNAAAFFVRRPIHKTDDRFYSKRMQGFIALVEMIEHRRAPSRRVLQHVRHSITNMDTVLGLMGKAIRGKLIGLSQFAMHVQAEPVPNRESRVMLADSKDALGMNQISVDWRLSPQDLDGMQRFEKAMLYGLDMYGVKTRRLKHDRDSEGWPVFMPSSKHHMGTTRMSENPHRGVVDQDCKVHGVGNLYIAGSSVFPTAGMANPTLTIVALAIRLAGHISRVLG